MLCKQNSLSFYGKNIHLIEKVSPTDQPYSRSLTNNLNKRTEKPYIVKEVRSLPDDWESRHTPETGICNSDVDNSEFDDHTTDTSLSLPPTPGLLSGKYSFSTSSLLDTDSSYSVDCRDSNKTISYDQLNDKTIFGVTLRKTRQSSTVSIDSRKRDSVSSISTTETTPVEQVNHESRCLSNITICDPQREIAPSDSDSDATNVLHQSTFIKIQHGSISDLSDQDSNELEYQKMLHNLDLHSTSGIPKINASVPCLQANKTQGIKQPATRIPTLNRQSSISNISVLSGPAFAPTGKRRMSDFLNNYRGQKSLPEINQKDENFDGDLSSQRTSDGYKLQNSFQSQLKESPKRDTFKKSGSERSFRAIHCNKESPKKNPFSKSQSERSFRAINCDVCQSSELKNIGSSRGNEEMKEETRKSVTEVNDISKKLPVSNKERGLAKTENILQSSRNNLATVSSVLSCEESINQSRYGKSDNATNHGLLQIPVTNVSDDVDNFSHKSEMPCTATQNEEDGLCRIDLNKTYVSEFQAKVRENFHTSTESEVNMATGQNLHVTISKHSGDKAVKGITSMRPLRRHKSIGDLLKEYTDISSLDQKSVFSNLKPYENVTKTESNKTIITISNSEMQSLPKAQNYGTSKEIVEKEKMHPSKSVGSNVKIPPVSKEDTVSVKDIYHNDRGTTKEVEDAVQMVDCITVDSKFQGDTDTSTIISFSDDTAISFSTAAMHHANVVYIGDNIKEDDHYFSEVSVNDKTSPVTGGPSENTQAVNIHDELLHPPKDTFNDVSPNGLKTEYDCTLQSMQSGSTGGESMNGNIASDPSQDETQINHVHTNTKKYVNEVKDIHLNIKKDEIDKPRTTGPHITVISVSETSDSPFPSHKHDFTSHLSDSSDDDLPLNDPVAMTRMIVHSSRTGNSNQKRIKRHNLIKASIPANSPFSPLRSQSSIPKAACKQYTEDDPSKKKLGPRDSYDEGVDFQMSDVETTPSPTSMESKSTSSLDIIGKEVCEPMV